VETGSIIRLVPDDTGYKLPHFTEEQEIDANIHSCDNCGVDVWRESSKVLHNKNIFCSVECHGKWMERRELTPKENNFVCEYCGEEGYKPPNILNKQRHHFCTTVCYYEWKSENAKAKCPNYECPQCGKPGYKKPSELRERNFCSQLCKSKWETGRKKVADNYTCHWCGKAGHRSPSLLKRAKHSFCSGTKCRYEWAKSNKNVLDINCSCANCGKPMHRHAYQLLRQKNQYCGNGCKYEHIKNGSFVACELCGKEMWVSNSDRSRHTFCSGDCSRKWNVNRCDAHGGEKNGN